MSWFIAWDIVAIGPSRRNLRPLHWLILAARVAFSLLVVSPPGMNRSMFLTSGSDANEAAMAIAKRYTGSYEVASPMVSFHGMSDTTRAVTFSGWHEGYGPYAPGNYPIFAPYGTDALSARSARPATIRA